MKRVWQPVLVFFIALAFFSWLQAWGGFTDPDGFYHAHITQLIIKQGPVMAFPWLDLTTIGQKYVDQNFLYHLALIPFQFVFGELWGTQVATVAFAAGFLTLFYFVMKALRVPMPWFWSGVLATMPIMMTRLSWAKSGPFALGLFVLGMLAVVLRKPFWAVIIGFAYALSHAGWPLLLACQGFYAFGAFLVGFIVYKEKGWRLVFEDARVVFATGVGIVVGCLLHPNREALLSFLWTQIVQTGIGSPVSRVMMGSEWYPALPQNIISFFLFPFAILVPTLFGLIVASKKLDRVVATRAIGFLCAFSVPFAWSLRSIRLLEYAAPLIILFVATLASLVDWKKLLHRMHEVVPDWTTPLFATLVLVSVIQFAMGTRDFIKQSDARFHRLAPAMSAVREIASTGDRVMHSDWDIFPELFLEDDRFRYVSGLDPTFLLEAHPLYSDAFVNLYLGQATTTAYTFIHDTLGARAVLVDRDDTLFDGVIRADDRFEQTYADEEAVVYKVQ